MSNFGIGLGSFMDGFQRGANGYSQIQDAKQQRKIRDQEFELKQQELADRQKYREITEQGTEQARQARQADIGKSIYRGSPDSDVGPVRPTYEVGGKQFADEAAATAEAEKSVGSFMDYYMKTTVPKLQEHWLTTGQPEKAQIMSQWMEQEDVKKGTKAWAGAVRAFQVGDREGFKKNLMAAYNQSGYYDDGYEAIGIEDVKNGDALMGYRITFRGPDGKEFSEEYDGEDVGRMGLYALAPDKVLEYGLQQLQAGQAAKAKQSEKLMDHESDIAKETHKSNLRREEEAAKRANGGDSTKVAEARAVEQYLRSKGRDDEYINRIAPRLVGVERQAMSPADRLAATISDLAKADFKFARLSPEEQVAEATTMLRLIDKVSVPEPSRKPQQSVDRPGAQPAPRDVQSGGGLLIYDRASGQSIYR